MKGEINQMKSYEKVPEVFLRAMEPEDLDLLYEIENDQSLWKVGVTNVPYSRYTLRDYIAHTTGDIYADRQMRLIIEDSEHQTVGILDLINFEPQHQRAEVGIVILESFRHQGLATAALEYMKRYAREVVHLHQLYAYIQPENEESLRLFQRVGFENGAILKDWLYDSRGYHTVCFMQFFF